MMRDSKLGPPVWNIDVVRQEWRGHGLCRCSHWASSWAGPPPAWRASSGRPPAWAPPSPWWGWPARGSGRRCHRWATVWCSNLAVPAVCAASPELYWGTNKMSIFHNKYYIFLTYPWGILWPSYIFIPRLFPGVFLHLFLVEAPAFLLAFLDKTSKFCCWRFRNVFVVSLVSKPVTSPDIISLDVCLVCSDSKI